VLGRRPPLRSVPSLCDSPKNEFSLHLNISFCNCNSHILFAPRDGHNFTEQIDSYFCFEINISSLLNELCSFIFCLKMSFEAGNTNTDALEFPINIFVWGKLFERAILIEFFFISFRKLLSTMCCCVGK
jgi:hypothetical protein